MVRAFDSRESGLGLSHGRRHCIVFNGQDTLLWLSHSDSLHPGVYYMQISTREFNAGGNPAMA